MGYKLDSIDKRILFELDKNARIADTQIAKLAGKKKELINYIKEDKRSLWIGVAEGAWNIGATFFVKSNEEFYNLKNEIFAKFKDIILESKTATLVEVLTTNKKFLHEAKSECKSIFKFLEKYELKDIEKKILKELFKNSRINIVDIANNHNSTVDIVRNRIKKLEQSKIISRYMINIDYNKL